MSSLLPGMPEHMVLAIEHHRALIEEAKRHREAHAARQSGMERPLRWRRLRRSVGELLIYMGQRLKAGTADTGAMNGTQHSMGIGYTVATSHNYFL